MFNRASASLRERFAQLGERLKERPLAGAWGVLSLGTIVACSLFPGASEWSPRLLPLAAQTLLLGGLLPLLTARRQEPARGGDRAAWFLWHLLLLVGTLAALGAARGSGGLPIAVLATALALLVYLTARRAVKRPIIAAAFYAAAYLPGVFLVPLPPAPDASCAEGRRLFGAYGCALCHQSTSRRPLMGLPNRLERLLAPGNEAVASPRAWLYLHLYAPEVFPSRERGRTCPAYRSLFALQKARPGARAPWALPVEAPDGVELVPTADARRLADYLLSLRASSAGPADREAVLARGETLFRAKCAACHGRDALGDSLNYPPLDDPQWLHLPEQEFRSIIMEGKKGKITVHGREWDGVMLPPGVTNERDAEAIRQYLQNRFQH